LAATASLQDRLAVVPAKHTVVSLATSMGDMVIELYDDRAPVSVRNFLSYVSHGFYEGTIFHRVIANFVIQGGGYDVSLDLKSTQPPIPCEANNGLTNDRGTVAMARTTVIDSANAQFFVNLKDNAFLNHRDSTAQGFGYAVFGKVIEGME